MVRALVLIGLVAVIAGGAIAAPSIMLAFKLGDPSAALGAPIVTNGIALILNGLIVVFLGRALALLQIIAMKSGTVDVGATDGKVVINCPKCQQQLRVPTGQRGNVSCPACKTTFQVQT